MPRRLRDYFDWVLDEELEPTTPRWSTAAPATAPAPSPAPRHPAHPACSPAQSHTPPHGSPALPGPPKQPPPALSPARVTLSPAALGSKARPQGATDATPGTDGPYRVVADGDADVQEKKVFVNRIGGAPFLDFWETHKKTKTKQKPTKNPSIRSQPSLAHALSHRECASRCPGPWSRGRTSILAISPHRFSRSLGPSIRTRINQRWNRFLDIIVQATETPNQRPISHAIVRLCSARRG